MVSTRTVIGLSGGVDSSVAAWLLKQQGHNLLGLFMINWRTTTGTLSGDCPWEEDLDVARLVARRLNIPLEVVDFSEQYSKSVVDYMFAEYAAGRTPNPDVLCNKEVKFNLFAHAAAERGGAQIATGHYCRKETVIIDGRETHRLLAGVDTTKDQSYFLCQLSQKQLDNVIFPIGNLMKSEVRQIATQANLITAGRKDSQGICFVGKVDLPIFLQQKLQSKEGVIVEIQGDKWTGGQVDRGTSGQNLQELATEYRYKITDGKIVGKHSGAHFFTIGQRKGLGVGGMARPLFVIGIDVKDNIVYVGQGDDHPGLYHSALFVERKNVHWIRPDFELSVGQQLSVLARVRYRQALQEARLFCRSEGIYVLFNQPQRGISQGQFVAWYCGEELVGSGVIGFL